MVLVQAALATSSSRPQTGRPLEVVAASEVEKLDALGDLIASGPDLSFIELSSGRVARIDAGVETLDMAAETSSFILIDAKMDPHHDLHR